VLRELHQSQPSVVVLQRRANPAPTPKADPLGPWVRPAIRTAVEDFVHQRYQLSQSWTHYELWTLTSPNDS
jgi:hypothetical protein